jgi:hypothetical protein
VSFVRENSFVAQRDDWIDPSGAPSREPAGDQSDDGKRSESRQQRREIEAADIVEQTR